MKPLSLKLRGAIGIRDGLGLDSIEIDFTRYAPGLVCIVGNNGSGKTTIMDNLHPFLSLPSRSGSLADHFYLRDSYRDLVFEMNGEQYRSYILIDAQTGKTEAYFYRQGIPLNDGKISTYKYQIERLMGTPELFFKSIFSAQGASGITALPPVKRKELFFELLGLQIYEAYCQYAGTVIAALENELAATRSLHQQLENEVQQIPLCEEHLGRATQNLATIRLSLADTTSEIDKAEIKWRDIENKVLEQRHKQKQLDQLQCEIATLENKLRVCESTHESDLLILARQSEPIQKEMTRLNRMMEHREEIWSHVQQLHDLSKKEQEYEKMEKEFFLQHRQHSEEKLKAQQALNHLNMEIAQVDLEQNEILAERRRLKITLDAKISMLEKQFENAQASSKTLDTAPCATLLDLSSKCQLLSMAVHSREELVVIEGTLQQLQLGRISDDTERKNSEEKLSDLRQKKAELMEALRKEKETLQSLEDCDSPYNAGEHQKLKMEIADLQSKKWEQLQNELLVAESVLQEKQSLLENLSSQVEAKKGSFTLQMKELTDQRIAKRSEALELITKEDYAEIERTWSKKLQELREVSRSLRAQELQVHSEMMTTKATLTRLQTKERELKETASLLSGLCRKIESWKLFQRACSKDGIPALELDAAGPAVSRIANDLLASSFGQQFQIAFETTKLSKDRKKQLETFAIRILGDGEEKHIEDLSGGERVWIERSISEAIAIYLSQKSGREYLTTYQDESDGALDPNNKQNFLTMVHESFVLGQRYFTFIITQTPEIWQQVGQRIHLSADEKLECIY